MFRQNKMQLHFVVANALTAAERKIEILAASQSIPEPEPAPRREIVWVEPEWMK
jgi:hypothetical protein